MKPICEENLKRGKKKSNSVAYSYIITRSGKEAAKLSPRKMISVI